MGMSFFGLCPLQMIPFLYFIDIKSVLMPKYADLAVQFAMINSMIRRPTIGLCSRHLATIHVVSLPFAYRELYITSHPSKRMGFFSSWRGVSPLGRRPRLPHGYGAKRQHPSLRAGGSKSRRPPVTSKKSIVFLWITNMVRFCKGLV
jgi:hypothetical protein